MPIQNSALVPKKRANLKAVSALTERSPFTIAPTRVAGTRNASASAWTESPNGRRYTSTFFFFFFFFSPPPPPPPPPKKKKKKKKKNFINRTRNSNPSDFLSRNPLNWHFGIRSLPSRIYSLPSRNQFPAASLLPRTSFPCKYSEFIACSRGGGRGFAAVCHPARLLVCVAASSDRLCCRGLKIRCFGSDKQETHHGPYFIPSKNGA